MVRTMAEEKVKKITGKAKVMCDDDHFTNSIVHITWGRKVKGVSIEIHPQCGRQNFAFFHPDNLHTLIAVLQQAEAEIEMMVEDKVKYICKCCGQECQPTRIEDCDGAKVAYASDCCEDDFITENQEAGE